MEHVRRLRRLVVCLALLALARSASADQTDIVGGTTTTGYPAVVAILSPTELCSGTLIGPSCVLTAAHCDFAPGDFVYFGNDIDQAQPYLVTVRKVHPDAAYDGLKNDLQVLELASVPAGITPMTRSSVTPSSGDTVTLVGFGDTSHLTNDAGLKRVVDASITGVDSFTIQYGDGSHGDCSGDSGGPVLRDTGSGLQQIGVVSYGDSNCTFTVASRTNNSFIGTAALGCTATRVADGIHDDDFESGSIAAWWLPNNPLLSIAVSPESLPVIDVGRSLQFTALGNYVGGYSVDLTKSATWSSTNPSVAVVLNDPAHKGEAGPIAPGTASVEADYGGMTGSTSMTSAPLATYANVNASNGHVAPGSCTGNSSCKVVDGVADGTSAWVAISSSQPWLQVDTGDSGWGKHLDHATIVYGTDDCSGGDFEVQYKPNGSSSWFPVPGSHPCSTAGPDLQTLDVPLDLDAWGIQVKNLSAHPGFMGVAEVQLWTPGIFPSVNSATFRTFASANSSNGAVAAASCTTANASCHAVDGNNADGAHAWSSGVSDSPYLQVDTGSTPWGKHVDHFTIVYSTTACTAGDLSLLYLANGTFTWQAIPGAHPCVAGVKTTVDVPLDIDAWALSIQNYSASVDLTVYEVQFWTTN